MSVLALLFAMQAPVLPDFDKRSPAAEIPAVIRGAWDVNKRACKDIYSVTRVHIGIDWIGFYESSGKLQISTQAGLPNFVHSHSFRFLMAGEGSTWETEMVFGWDGKRPEKLAAIEPKTAENMQGVRSVETWERCTK